MRKIPLFLKILVPVLVVFAAAGIFFCVKLIGTNKLYTEKSSQAEAIEETIPDKNAVDFRESKKLRDYEYREYESLLFNYAYSTNEDTYEFKNIEFISFSKNWDEDNLKDLCDELFENKHGDEIYEIDAIAVYDDYFGDYPSIISPDYDWVDVPVSLFDMFPEGFAFSSLFEKKVISIFYGDYFDTAKQMAYMLSHEYGLYFMSYYFNLYGDDETVESDPYFKLRHEKDFDFYYSEDEFDDWDAYTDNNIWYLLQIAADDYVYLMGSPNTKRTIEYIDTLDRLRLDNKDKQEELDEYFDLSIEDSFNARPHLNVVLPLPDQIKGLPELIYETIGLTPPAYEDNSKKAEEIEIDISKRSSHGERYYSVEWDKPWEDEEVTYTLVAYDEDDNVLGGIKTIDGTERARAIIGGAVLDTSSTSWTWYDSDYWSDQGFLRFRIIVTFKDGTAAVSPSADWSFE